MAKLKGAYYIKRRQNWRAEVNFNGYTLFLGYFPSELKAHNAYVKARAYLESLKPGDEHYKFFEQSH